MRRKNVCSNVFKVYINFTGSRGLTQAFVLAKKVCDENRKKERLKNDGCFIQGDQGDESAIRNY